MLLISVAVGVLLIIKKENNVKYPGAGNELQYVYSSVELIYYCERSGISIDSALIDELKNTAEWVFDAYATIDLDGKSTELISKLIVIETYFGINNKLNLSQELYERYRQDQQLFVGYPIQNNSKYEIHPDDVISNYFILEALSISDSLSSENSFCKNYPIENGLVQWFSKTTASPSETEKKDISMQSAWITLLVNMPAISDCSGIRDIVEDEYTAGKSGFEEENSLRAVGEALRLHKLAESLGLETDYSNYAQKLYCTLDSEDSFGFYAEDYATFAMMNGEFGPLFEEYGTLEGNAYFFNNVNRWLKENAQKHINPVYENN